MSQNENAVCLPLGQEVRWDIGRRHVSNGNAVDLRTEQEAIDAVGADDGLNGGQLVTMLCGDGVEVIGHPTSALESGENGQTADHGELSGRHGFGQRGQRCHQRCQPGAHQTRTVS